ncbi:MAG: hypothetical protein AVDCRST_MAG53-2059, partial [uncultured Solirubrobacteraceae bacterium]
AATGHHPSPNQPLRGCRHDRRRRVPVRPLARRHRAPRRVVAAPVAARLRGDRAYDVPRAPHRRPHGPRRGHARRPRADRARGRAPRRLSPACAVRQGVPPPPRPRPVGLSRAPPLHGRGRGRPGRRDRPGSL